jgi:acyl-CoA reductase-like NAD-dependent aldehyde dehydrogenase
MTDRLVSYDPRTRQPVGEVAVTSPAEMPAAVERSRKAFEVWSALPFSERKRLLIAFKKTVLARGEEIAEVVSAETGKPVVDAYPLDVLTALSVIDHYARKAHKYLRPRRAGTWPYISTKAWTTYQPRGVAGVISPWNYPFFLSMIPAVTALAAGCSVVLKPSEKTPLTGQLIGDLATSAGLPPDLVQVVQGEGDVGQAVVENVDVVAFIGSTAVGRKVAETAARRLIPAILELGGNDPIVVLEDANLRQAARAAVWSGMLNGGQTCVSVERVYVVDQVHDRFMEELGTAMKGVQVGGDSSRDIGPMIDRRQAEMVTGLVDDAVAHGARVIHGGRSVESEGGYYYEPTILADVEHAMPIMQDETFGPVLAVVRVPDEETAIGLANDSRFGLHATVWSKDRDRASRVASRLRSGTVAINDAAVNFVMPTLPFGGIGESGVGVAFGAEGIRSYCVAQGVTAARFRIPTTAILGARFPRRRGLAYWKTLARALFRW